MAQIQISGQDILTDMTDYFYLSGQQSRRLFRRLHRVTARPRKAVVGWLSRRIFAPVGGFFRRLGHMFGCFPVAGRELAAAARRSFPSVFPCFGDLVRRAVRRYKDELLILWGLVGPAAALTVLLVTVSMWTKTPFCLSLTYNGENLGCIDREGVYDEAAALARDRVINEDDSFSVAAVPGLAITVQGSEPVLTNTELCDAILRTAGDSIAEAIGLYVDDGFVGATESEEELNVMLNSIKAAYYDGNDPDQRAEFVQKVSTVEGLFPTGTVVVPGELKSKLTAQAVVEKTYTAQPGDSVIAIAQKNNMTTTELRALNPMIANSDMIHVGDTLVVQRPQSFLQVKVVKTVRYTEAIPYTTQTTYNSKQDTSYRKVKVKGQEGSQDVVADITYLDGIQISKKITSTTVTKQPVTEVLEKGTKKTSTYGPNTGEGDGVTTGSMLWPVPICHNMSRGYGRGHSGLDICNGPVTVKGKPAVAADGGTVIYAGWYYGYGNYIKIQHANGLCTAYGHLQTIQVAVGQKVTRGQQIALIGSTGQSSGPHLHFEVIKNGSRVNPLRYVSR